MAGTGPTELTVLFARRPGRDESTAAIAYRGYDIFWPDGRPVRLGLQRFCRLGSSLLVGRHHDPDTALIRLTLYPVGGREAPLTRPGQGIRCRRFYTVRHPESVRLYLLDGTPTEVVFDPSADEPEVLQWLQVLCMPPGEPFWFDLASQTLNAPSRVAEGMQEGGWPP